MHLLVGNSLTRHDFHGKGHDTFVKIAPAMLQQAVSVAVNQKMTWKLPGATAQISGGAKAEKEGVRVVKPVDFTHFKKMSHAWVNRENLLHLLSCQWCQTNYALGEVLCFTKFSKYLT